MTRVISRPPGSASKAIEDDPRWMAVVRRDPAADGQFYYAVRTTGIYCRPSCPSRRANPRHVELYGTREAAEMAGFRPCRRCRPDLPPPVERAAASVARACRAIDAHGRLVALSPFARSASVGLRAFERLFREQTGLTPRAYAAGARAGRMRSQLRTDRRVIDAAFAAGFGSAGRFYAAAGAALGMAPRTYRQGGTGMTIRWGTTETSLGLVLAAQTVSGVCAVMLGDDEATLVDELAARFPRATLVAGDASFAATLRAVATIVEDPGAPCRLPIDLQGTAFQRRVWRALQQIPAGTTVTYGELARRIGAPKAVRAVAAACGANPVAVLVPCHRVVGADGRLTGYRWGLARKARLIEAEAAAGVADTGLGGRGEQTTRARG